MANAPRYLLEQTGGLDGNQRALADVSLDMDAVEALAGDPPYTPGNPADWVAPAPTTLREACDRLAAAGGVTPVP
jgi:hypothetical protein